MSTLGDTSQGTTAGTAAGVIMLNRVLATADADIDLMRGWVQAANASYAKIIFLVFNGTSTHPTTLHCRSDAFFGPPDGSMADRSAAPNSPASVTSGNYYWVGVQIQHDSSNTTSGEIAGRYSYNYYGASFDSVPSDLTSLGASYDGFRYGFYLEVTESGSGITGSLSVTESNDSVSSVGALSVAAVLAAVESSDTVVSGAALSVQGSLSSTEQSDSLASATVISIVANAAITEASDSLSADGSVLPLGINGALSVTESNDSVSSAGALSLVAALAVTEQSDSLTGETTVGIVANSAVSEGSDSLVADGAVSSPGAITGNLSVTESNDSAISAGTLSISASSNISEQSDTIVSAVLTFIVANLNITEANDSLSARAGDPAGPYAPNPSRAFAPAHLSRDLAPEKTRRIFRGNNI